MKKKKWLCLLLWMLIFTGLGSAASSFTAEAAVKNVVKSPKAPKGKWVKTQKGWRYQCKNGKYLKNTWKKIKKEIYAFEKKGYMITGWKRSGKSWYYLSPSVKKEGALVTGWKTIGGKRYYLSKKTGIMASGWTKIGKKTYYFTESGKKEGAMVKNKWVEGRYLGKNGAMAVNCQVGNVWVGADGKKLPPAPVSPDKGEEESEKDTSERYIFLGDSRTVGMKTAVKSQDTYIAKVGEGYLWLKTTGLKKLRAELKKDPKAKVILNLGVNDGGIGAEIAEEYIAVYRKLMEEYPETRFYILSVNPVVENKKHMAKNKFIKRFNQAMERAFPGQYLDSNTYLTKQGFQAADGLHYSKGVYQSIYQFVMERTK